VQSSSFQLATSLDTMRFIIASLLLASVAMAADMGMNIHGGAYNFGYHTGDAGGHSRSESGHGGNVAGSYSYVDANGDHRVVQYTAGPDGFKPSGDIGVDKKTASIAAAMNAMAPKAPVAAPAHPGWYGAPAAHWGAPAAYWGAPAAHWAPAPQAIMGPAGYHAKW